MIKAFFSSQLIEAVGWALLHSLWQGVILAVVLGLLLLFLRKFSSQTRYIIIALFMALFTATLPLNIIRQYKPALEVNTTVRTNNKAEVLPGKVFSPPVREKVRVSENSTAISVQNRFSSYFERHLPLLVTLWLMGIFVLLLRYLGQLVFVQRLKHYGAVPFPDKWNDLICKLEKQLKITTKVRYVESLRVASPLTIGWLKPVILFPIGLAARLSTAEVEVILLHELAHIKRHDYFFNVLQSLITILLFYHPAAHWMSGLLDEERENCCDDLVVELTGQQEKYASTLIHLQEQKFKTMKPVLSFTGKKSFFSGRILRLVNNSFPAANRFREGFVTAIILVGGLSFLAAAGVKTPAKVNSASVINQSSPSENDTEKVDLFIKAIDDEDEKLFGYLLKQGVDINGRSSEGWTPLGYAAAENRLEYVKKLLDKGALVNPPATDQHPPLLAAAAEGHLEVVKLLVERGAKTDTRISNETALLVAAREGHSEVVRFLMPLSPKLSATERVGMLITAMDEDKPELFEYWIDQGADINSTSQEGWTPLGFAAEEGHLKYVKLLLARGAKMNNPASDEQMPLLAASGEGHLSTVKTLLEAGATLEATSQKGTTALAMAAREGHLEVVEFLLAKKANPNKANQEGWTALHFVASEGHTSVMNRLIAAGANIELPVTTEYINWNNGEGRRVIMQGWTPLLIAIEEEQVENVKALLAARANVNVPVGKTVYVLEGNYKDDQNTTGKLLYEATCWTPLMEAKEKQNVALVKLLLASGADKKTQTKEGISAGSIAEKLGNKEILQLLR